MRSVPRFVCLAVASSCLAIAGCNSRSDSTTVIAIGAENAAFAKGGKVTGPARMVRSATHEGLLGFDAEGRVVPALAERWILTDDGMSYLFRLREGTLPDGREITASTVRTALMAAMASARGSPLSADLRAVSEIRVMAVRVLEIRLSSPHPYVLEVLAQPELGLSTPAGKPIGPLWVEREKDAALLSAHRPGAKTGTGIDPATDTWRRVRLVSLPAAKAIARFDQGDADLVLDGRYWDYPLANRVRLTGGTIRFDPVNGLFGLAVISARGFLSEPANREALAMTIDRTRLGNVPGQGNWQPANLAIPGDVAGLPPARSVSWAALDPAERRRQAGVTVSRWKSGTPGDVIVQVALPEGPGADSLAALLAEDFAAIGVKLERVKPAAAADLRLIDQIAPYNHAQWYLQRLSCAAAQMLCIKAIDQNLAAAQLAAPGAEQDAFFAKAEAAAGEAQVFIPLGAPVRWSLVRGTVPGFVPNQFALHPLIALARATK